ncbi:MAG: hypothetical protein NZ518_03345, partial [Dehalococcoidia bacterium]|nr:hypothetical protein [Dehalococcoidia bacterium]
MNPSPTRARARATPDEIAAWVIAAQRGDADARATLLHQFHPLFVARSRFAPSFEDAYQDAVVAFLELLRAYDP